MEDEDDYEDIMEDTEIKPSEITDIWQLPFGNISYIPFIFEKLYAGLEISEIEEKISKIPLSSGVCARPFTKTDVGWFCQTCQKDKNCVICQDCFEHSNHIGHPLYLKRTVAGCCDCGDNEAWDPKGFCENHQGFIDEKKADFNLLPAEIISSAKFTIEKLCDRLFSICMNISFLETDFGKINIQEEVAKLFEFLQKISDKSPIFLYEVSRNFIKARSNFMVQNEESDSKIKFEILDITENPRNLLDAIIKMHKFITEISIRKKIINFCINHIKSKPFKISLAESYIRNYKKVLENARLVYTSSISSLGVQILGSNETTEKICNQKKLLNKFIKAVISQIKMYCEKPIRENFYNLFEPRHDIRYLVKENSYRKFIENDFIGLLLENCMNCSFISKIVPITEHILFENDNISISLEAEKCLLKMFMNIMRCVNYLNDFETCLKIANIFKKLIENTYAKSLSIKWAYFNIPLHRCLSFFIINFVYTQLIFNTLEPTSENIRKILKNLFQIDSDKNYLEFIKIILEPILKSIGIMLEISARKWIKYGDSIDRTLVLYMQNNLGFAKYDFALLQLILASMSEKYDNFITEFILRSINQNDNWLSQYLQILFDEKINSNEEINTKLAEFNIDPKKISSILEQILYMLIGICTNDCLGIPIFLKGIKPKIVKQPYCDIQKINDIIKYALRKEIIHSYFKNKSLWVTIPMIIEKLPKCYRKNEFVEPFIREMCEILKDNVKNIETFRIKQAFCENLYNPYFYLMQGNIESADEKSEEFYKKEISANSDNKFNPIFGNQSTQNIIFPIDFPNLITNFYKLSDLNKIIEILLKRGANDNLSDLSKIYLLKLSTFTHLSNYPKICQTNISILAEKFPHYKKIFTDFLSTENREISTESKISSLENAKLKRKKILEEFNKKSANFALKNAKILAQNSVEELKTEEKISCGICKENLSKDSFNKQPFGKLISIINSGVYKNYLTKILPEETEENIDFYVSDPLVIQTCGHFMHYDCILKLQTKENNENPDLIEQKWKLSIKNCPLCFAPLNYILPTNECTDYLNFEKGKEMEWVLGAWKKIFEISENYNELDYNDNFENCFRKIINDIIFYKIIMRDLYLENYKEFIENFDLILSLINIGKKRISNGELKIYNFNEHLSNPISLNLLAEIIDILTFCKIYLAGISISEIDNILIIFLKLHIWKIIAKYASEQGIENFSMETVFGLITAKKDFLKICAYDFLQKVILLRTALFFPMNLIEIYNLINSNNTELEKFDLILCFINFNKDLFDFDEFCKQNYVINFPTKTQILQPDTVLFLVNLELNLIKPKKKSASISYKLLNYKHSYKFINLEDDFTELQKIHYKRECENCNLQVKANALCLLCGKILCVKEYCCMYENKDEVRYHAEKCSNGIGICLFFWHNQIILVSRKGSAICQSPYTNQYGESVDISKKITFETLKLNNGILEKLRILYIKDKIDQEVSNLKKANMGATI